MKKLFIRCSILFIIMFYCCSITVSTKATAFITSVTVDLKDEGKEISIKLPAKEIYFQNKPYIQQCAVMFPLKELLEVMGTKAEVTNNKQQGTMTVTIGENKIQFFDKQKRVIVDGIEKGLYNAANVVKNDVYISVYDTYVLFHTHFVDYGYLKEEGIHRFEIIFGEDIDEIKVNANFKQEIHNYYIDTKEVYDTMKDSEWYETSKSFPPYRQKKEYLLTNKICNTYEKYGEIMIAVADMEKLTVPNTLWDIKWNGEQNTAIIKTYNTTPNDIIITKDSNIMNLNGKNIEMVTAAEIKNNRLYIPIKAMFEILDVPEQNVKWIAETEVIFTY
ncbi:stalk domain-containing protein [Clostridium sp. MD294]|uniref:stalk domain-containing protein n=1 Tax=Clostridium sp. MD294 TaxID=97138 RepID=UPI0002CBFD28|nr:stalk domain-containing protein [Clostridium sp. MD294]USF30313.1 hypothetical protein C820_001754 [Clostridium sp. MD294]